MFLPMFFGCLFGVLSIVSNRIENRADRVGIGVWAVLIGLLLGRILFVVGFPPIYLLTLLSLPAGVLISIILKHW